MSYYHNRYKNHGFTKIKFLIPTFIKSTPVNIRDQGKQGPQSTIEKVSIHTNMQPVAFVVVVAFVEVTRYFCRVGVCGSSPHA